ncbi:MAG: DUF2182 domain-containing protein [Proteobacteria bacterium]|nr:DUF2182 domain-containing protein [Pseudomonadota bacterium]
MTLRALVARSSSHGSSFLPLLAGLIGLAWLTLWIWATSPYARYLDHGQWAEIGIAASICAAIPGGSIVVPLLLYMAGWLLMSAAMMLPTTMPLIQIFDRLTAARSDRRRLGMLVMVGYLGAWSVFGGAVYVLDWLLHELARASSWLTVNGWIVGAAVLATAGLFQFSRLKYHCLDKCRAPLGFVMQHWRGAAHGRHALLLGVHHGLYCVGCCWAIMLLLFVVGAGSVGWMLALGAVMAVEKNMPWGRKLSQPLGFALLVWAAFILLQQAPAAIL